MSYEEKYKEALKRADSLTEKYGGREFAEYVFPDLAESEDERIVNALISYFEWYERSNPTITGIPVTIDGFSVRDVIAWLEKQKEQKQPLSEKIRSDFPAVADFLDSVDDMEKNRAIGILEDYLKWAVSSEEECRYTWKELADAIQLGIDAMKEQKPAEWSEDMEQAAARYERENRQSVLSSVDIVNAFIEGARWMESQMPLPEDTVIFQKGVAEGRRLEREDNNKALAEMYGYEGGTESPLVKITFTIPKEQVKNLMPIKQGDVFGIENLTNKEGRR